MKKFELSSLIEKLKKHRIMILIAGLLVLSVSQQKFLMPLVYDVIKSDLFLIDSKDQGSNIAVSTPLSNLAFMQCNNYIKSKADADESFSFTEKPLKVWSIGNYEYIVNAEINVTNNSVTTAKKYTCRITYDNGENEEGVLDMNNWSIVGISDF